MSTIPDTVDYDLAKIWLAQQDLKEATPEQVKRTFFDFMHKLETVNVERWD